MHSWVGKPLRRREAIEERLDAVQELVETGGGAGRRWCCTCSPAA
jgi:hypothetical protein